MVMVLDYSVFQLSLKRNNNLKQVIYEYFILINGVVKPYTKRRLNSHHPLGIDTKFLNINPLPSLTLQSARNLNVACRPKRSKALLLPSSYIYCVV